MDVTPKQARNGVPGPSGVNSSMAQPGPMDEFPQAAAEAAGNMHKVIDPPPTGRPTSDAHLEWDMGLAVKEVAGEA